MEHEDDGFDFTQTQQQFTQTQTQPASDPQQLIDPNLWGLLIPVSPNPTLTRIELRKSHQGYSHTIGRKDRHKLNDQICPTDTVIRDPKISTIHCRIWLESSASQLSAIDLDNAIVRIEDLSTNGTYVRRNKVGKGHITVLHQGDEVTFGPANGKHPEEEHSYIFQTPYHPVLKSSPAELSGFHAKYELHEQIGKGSFASVSRAIERATGTMRAVKIINKAKFRGNAKTMIMLQREVEIMKELDHPHIVRFFDFFENDDYMWLVLEYVAGGDLLEYVMNRGGLPEDQGAEIASQMCSAIAYLHEQGIAHRDLKPENILLTAGDNPIVKVADFGLAKMLDQATMLATMCGTPAYLSPEVILQGPDRVGYTFAVDAWSLGVIVYACLANQQPWDEDENLPLQDRMRMRVPDLDLLREIPLSEKAIDFISRLLTMDPGMRMSCYDAQKHPWIARPGGSSVLLPYNSRSQENRQSSPQNTCHTRQQTETTSVDGSETSYPARIQDLNLNDSSYISESEGILVPESYPLAEYSSPRHNALPDNLYESASKKRKEPTSAFSSDSSMAQPPSQISQPPSTAVSSFLQTVERMTLPEPVLPSPIETPPLKIGHPAKGSRKSGKKASPVAIEEEEEPRRTTRSQTRAKKAQRIL